MATTGQRRTEDRDLYDLFERAHKLMITYPEGSEQHTFALQLKEDYGKFFLDKQE